MSKSTSESKLMVHKGKYPKIYKIVIEGTTLEQVSHFEYLSCKISFGRDKDMENTLIRN
jgi:hypothetical protein